MAGRIPQHFIDDLLARVNIVDVIDGRIKLKRAGKNYSALCPFHKEKSPSFSVSPDKQFYYCFGCGAGGNALGFLMEYERLSFPEAVEELARLVGIDVPRENNSAQDIEREQRVKQQYSLLDQANQFYQSMLRKHGQRDQAVNYLKNRGIQGRTAALFQIGYAPAGWDNLISHINDESRASELEKSGLVIHNEEKERYYDRFRDRIMFPIRDMRGRTIGFGGRVLTDEKPKYLNSPETDTFHKGRELYGLYEARQSNSNLQRVLIVEGYMDVVSLYQNGISWSVATLGTATTAHHLERIFKMVPEVIFCFDGDNAGRTAAARALRTALPVIKDGLQARFLFLPDGEDPDSLVQKEGRDAFTARVNGAQPLSEYFFRSLSEEADLESMDGRARFSSEALPLIQEMQPSLLKQMMLDRICELTGLSMQQLNSVIELHQQNEKAAPAPTQNKTTQQYTPSSAPTSDYADYEDYDYEGYSSSADYGSYAQEPQPATRGRAFSSAKTRGGLNLVTRIISLLLHNPQLAKELPDSSEFIGINENQSGVLVELLHYFQNTPDASLGTLLIDWQMDEMHAADLLVINEISHLEPVLASVDNSALIKEASQRLLQRKHEGELDDLLKKSRQSPLTESEKQRLQQLLIMRHQH